MKQSIILLHGLFGALSNWQDVVTYFKPKYDIHIPLLPIFEDYKGDGLESMVIFLGEYIKAQKLENVVLVGNSLGGHVAILYTHSNPEKVTQLILTGSSGLYENTSAGGFVRRGNLTYIRERVAYTFYDPAIATDELISDVFAITSDNKKCFSILKMAKSAQRNYVADILPEIRTQSLLLWGENDKITPIDVAMDFKRLLPDTELSLLKECGHAPMMERPEEFNKQMELFLDRQVNRLSQDAYILDNNGRKLYY